MFLREIKKLFYKLIGYEQCYSCGKYFPSHKVLKATVREDPKTHISVPLCEKDYVRLTEGAF